LSQSNSDILKFEEEMRTVAKGESVEVADAGDSVLGLHRLKNVPNQSWTISEWFRVDCVVEMDGDGNYSFCTRCYVYSSFGLVFYGITIYICISLASYYFGSIYKATPRGKGTFQATTLS
jgi:hypothetical protein